ncbi:MAG: ROK family protein [Chloroflexi bacterium]|nr:ROK family protein [Chloroflexota bacterium]
MVDEHLVVGIDLGGTKISTALVTGTAQIVARDYRETRASDGQDAIIDRMMEASRLVMAQAGVAPDRIAAVGVGSPGPLDIEAGIVRGAPNLPGWHYVPLKQRIEESLGIATFLENDANAAAVGEHRFGAGQGVDHMIYVTVSTGIGGGLILNGSVYYGVSGTAGEIGHTTILANGPRCGCGNRGCVEALASGTAIAREARDAVARGVSPVLHQMCEGDPDRITARMVAEAAAQHDPEASRIMDTAMEYLGIGMANLVNLFNPQLIVIGGGVANVGDVLFDPVRRGILRHALPAASQDIQVVGAKLGDDVGVLGAAAVALTRIGL